MLTVCGIDELLQHNSCGITHVLSILDPECPDPEALLAYGPHQRTVLRFHDVIEPRPWATMPDRRDVEAIIDLGEALAGLAQGSEARLLIHCQAGISRSTAAAALLLATIFPEQNEDDIFRDVMVLRPQAWPNSRMVGFGDELLSRQGRLTRALVDFYARQLLASPARESVLREHGRGSEVEMGLRLMSARHSGPRALSAS